MPLPRALAVVAAAAALASAPALASAADTVLLSGWATLGEDMPLTGARVVFTDGDGERIPGLSARTGLSGEFTVQARRDDLPPRVIAHAGMGMVDEDEEGPDRPERLTGWLRAPVDLTGPEAGLVYITPISTAALALTPEYGTYAKASIRVRYLLRMPSRSQSSFQPWADGGARLATSDRLVDPQRLVDDIQRDGGVQGWVDEMEWRDERGMRANYRARAGAREQSLGGFLKKGLGVMKKVAPGLQVAGAIWGVISDQAKTCNPGQSVVPGLGPLASWMQKQGVVQQDPACQIPGQINSLSVQLNSRLDGIQAELGQIKQLLVAQSAQFARIEGVVLQSASTNVAATLSGPIAAIQTAQERRLLLVNLVATFTAPRTPANVQGLGMTLDEIYASSDPAAVRAATIINRQAERAVPSNVSGWDTAATRMTLPGVLIPGYGSDGMLQLAWKATWAASPANGASYEDELQAFSDYVDYFRNLWFLYGVQEIDSLRSDGLPGELVEQQVMARAPFDDILESLIPDTSGITYGVPECSELMSFDPGAGAPRSFTCVLPAASAGRTSTTPNGDFRYSARVRLTFIENSAHNHRSFPLSACALPGHGGAAAVLDIGRWSAASQAVMPFDAGMPWRGSGARPVTLKWQANVRRCDSGPRPASAPWPPGVPQDARFQDVFFPGLRIPFVNSYMWDQWKFPNWWTAEERARDPKLSGNVLLSAPNRPLLIRIDTPPRSSGSP